MKVTIKEKYQDVWNFLAAYFGDYWEGKTEKDILKEAFNDKGNSENYLTSTQTKIKELIADQDFSLAEKAQLIRDTNLYFKEDEEALAWLKLISGLMSEIAKQRR